MSTEVVTRIYMFCDLHGKPTEGTETLTVGLNGKNAEVDVCAECSEMLRRTIQRAVEAGRRVAVPSSRRTPAKSEPGRRAYLKALRQFCKDNDLRNPKNPDVLAYETPSGSTYYPPWVEQKYAEATRAMADSA